MTEQSGGPSVPQLQIDALSVTYETRRGSLLAVDNMTMSVGRKEFVAVLGPSGCGKSTLLKIVSGLLRPSGGQALLDGSRIEGPRRDVGIVFQQPVLLPWKTVVENVLVPIRALRLNENEHRGIALDLLKLVGLEKFADHYPRELSGGMQQRVGIARGLVHNPRLLLMDEPFAALDAMTREQMSEELQSIWMETDKAVLFITHSIHEAVFLADRVIVLSERPAKVIDDVVIDLPRPRQSNIASNPRFGELCAHLKSHFTTAANRTESPVANH
ncbi:ABC transporter ATP-binding protein [Bordetella parapertussis]|uniref:ABC transporter ATP-binding protein n=3 Tax=Bordetella TaxID=517 RepID=A0A0H3LIX1_BORBR|nr:MULTISPECIES: ABC transporter ATP-binding protein [Bordetella]KAK68284.1 ABC transporter, ATP-binding protein [Bordetella bronchiseptica 980-2]AMG87173.1 ABC transporter [Bordetella bronchiseptica]AOB37956.1 ABC transporter [Bordetella parapertussis]AUL41929.1 ABC transporter [Bordetella parapertussis]AWP61843.1 ABC transporter [Bordetella parapertussis]